MTADPRRLLLVARPYDLSDSQYDGFVARRLRVVESVRRHYDVSLLLLRPPTDAAEVHPLLSSDVYGEIAIRPLDNSRRARFRRLSESWRFPVPEAHAAAVARAVDEIQPSAAITFGPWLQQEFRPVFAAVPTIHFFEEELARMVENAPQSAQARLFRRAEAVAHGTAVHQPHVVVIIGMRERRAAHFRYPKAQVLWHPFLLDPASFPPAESASDGHVILVVGQFGELRNAEGLRDVLHELRHFSDAPRVSLVSHSDPHAALLSHVSEGRLLLDGFVEDLYERYRTARLTLVPARRVTGIKTTVLQAWAAGTPVVCFPASADSVGPFAREAAAIGSDPAAVANRLMEVFTDRDARQRIADAGLRLYQEHFDPWKREQELLSALERLPPPPASGSK